MINELALRVFVALRGIGYSLEEKFGMKRARRWPSTA